MEYLPVNWRATDLYKNVSDADWYDWRWQIKNGISDIEHLEKVVTLTDSERENLKQALEKFTMAITPYYAALMDPENPNDPVRMQSVPRIEELYNDPSDLDDPLHEDVDSPVPGLTHRYPDRVLLLITNICSMNCRHCTRRRLVGFEDMDMPDENIAKAIEYIRQHAEIRDVLISGGDPLVLSDDRLESIISRIRAIEHVEIIRIGTRAPVVMPMRITDGLVTMLKKYHPIYVNTHFNHAKEITQEARTALAKLADAGIPLGNQSVLLKGINDCPQIMKQLLHKLLTVRVKPYYIYQCDLSMGISHFRTTIARGIEIMESLRGHTTGMAVPTFVVDAPGGGGKIPVMPNYVIVMGENRVILRNYEGVITTYTEPEREVRRVATTAPALRFQARYKAKGGVASLLAGDQLCLEPADLARKVRKF